MASIQQLISFEETQNSIIEHEISTSHLCQENQQSSHACLDVSSGQKHAELSQFSYQEGIASNFNRINIIIDKIDSHLIQKFQNYEHDLLAIVKEEIDQMNRETRRLVNSLQQKIAQKQSNEELWYLRNQSEFFKSQALQLFQINKELRSEIKILKRNIKELENEFEINDLLLQKFKKKQIKQNLAFKKLIDSPLKDHLMKIRQADAKPIKILKLRQRLKTEASKNIKTEEDLQSLKQNEGVKKFENEVQHQFTPLNSIKAEGQVKCSKSNSSFNSQAIDSRKSNYKTIIDPHKIMRNSLRCEYFSKNIDASTQTQSNTPHLNLLSTKARNSPFVYHSLTHKGINFVKSGLSINKLSKSKPFPQYRKSADCHSKQGSNMVEMNRNILNNKLEIFNDFRQKFQDQIFRRHFDISKSRKQ